MRDDFPDRFRKDMPGAPLIKDKPKGIGSGLN